MRGVRNLITRIEFSRNRGPIRDPGFIQPETVITKGAAVVLLLSQECSPLRQWVAVDEQ